MNQERISHPGLAAVFSFIFNGLGQLYNGQLFKGLVIICLSVISMLILAFGSILIGFWLLGKIVSIKMLGSGIALFIIGIVFICILGIYSIVDAYRFASEK